MQFKCVMIPKYSQPAGFEPARGDPIGFQVQRLNRSATTALLYLVAFQKGSMLLSINVRFPQPFLQLPYIEVFKIFKYAHAR